MYTGRPVCDQLKGYMPLIVHLSKFIVGHPGTSSVKFIHTKTYYTFALEYCVIVCCIRFRR